MKYSHIALAAGALFATTPAAAPGQMMGHAPPVPMPVKQFLGARTGQNVQIAVRVERRKRATVSAELLEHRTDTLAKATGRRVTLYVAAGTPVMMGTASDIVPGAVLFVYGVVTKPGSVDVKRTVIDTKYVKVE